MKGVAWCACLSALSVTVGCGSDNPEPVTITAVVVSYDGDPSSGEPVELVQVCELATRNCDTTDEAGQFELELPRDSEVALTLVKEGFGDTLVSDVTDEELNTGRPTILLPTEGWIETFATQLGTSFPTCPPEQIACENGIVLIITRDGLRRDDNPIAGVSYELIVGEGEPYYLDDEGNGDPSLEATGALGAGGFYELKDIGKIHEVSLSGMDGDCRAAAAWPGEEPNTIRFMVLDKFLTQATVVCD